jgi:hypothetical protein
MGLQIQIFNASTGREINAAFAAIARERSDALFIRGLGAVVATDWENSLGVFTFDWEQLVTAIRPDLGTKNASLSSLGTHSSGCDGLGRCGSPNVGRGTLSKSGHSKFKTGPQPASHWP